jgi:hypothetical protein
MTDYTAAEVEAAIDAGDDAGEFEKWYDFEDKGSKNILTLRGEEIEVETIADDCGGEGHGENVWLVIKVGDQLFEKTGYYASHYGTDWDGDFTEVHPVEKTITVYEAKTAA